MPIHNANNIAIDATRKSTFNKGKIKNNYKWNEILHRQQEIDRNGCREKSKMFKIHPTEPKQNHTGQPYQAKYC
mgnify:CR=1 FL=1